MPRAMLMILLIVALMANGCRSGYSKKCYIDQSPAEEWLAEHPLANATFSAMLIALVGLGLLAGAIALWYLDSQTDSDESLSSLEPAVDGG